MQSSKITLIPKTVAKVTFKPKDKHKVTNGKHAFGGVGIRDLLFLLRTFFSICLLVCNGNERQHRFDQPTATKQKSSPRRVVHRKSLSRFSESELNFPFWERNGSRATVVDVTLLLRPLFFSSISSLISHPLISPLPQKLCSCASFVSAASESCASHWFVSLPQKLCIFCLRCLRSCAGHWFVSLPQSCASFVSAALEVVQVIGLSRCLRSCAENTILQRIAPLSFDQLQLYVRPLTIAVAFSATVICGDFLCRLINVFVGYIWVGIKLMHERNKISIEFSYDVPYDSDSGKRRS
ncbi:hypothetical protein H5410_033469 [Solanum commersonii]|uniref:Uncharacterized protein n=1 Tax=Solanum commersonii TaxID=4109 RepID=A0A9J5YMW6_SOLCO|nr:hypothetical protein H5410_033469 [Solanum commersonii]